MSDPVPSKERDMLSSIQCQRHDCQAVREDLRRIESARVAILAENTYYKQRVADLTEELRQREDQLRLALDQDRAAAEPSAEQVLERGRQVVAQGLRLRYRVAEHPVPRTGYVLVWHEDKGQLFPTAWHTASYHHAQMGANLYPPAVYWEGISAPESAQPPGDGC